MYRGAPIHGTCQVSGDTWHVAKVDEHWYRDLAPKSHIHVCQLSGCPRVLAHLCRLQSLWALSMMGWSADEDTLDQVRMLLHDTCNTTLAGGRRPNRGHAPTPAE